MLKALKSNKYYLSFGLGMIFLRILVSYQPQLIDDWYTNGLFLVLRPIFDYTLGFLPFPAFYLFLLLLIAGLVWKIQQWRQIGRFTVTTITNAIISIISFGVFVVGLFLFVWGFNYAGSSVEQKMGFDLNPISPEELKQELEEQTKLLVGLRNELTDSVFTQRVFSKEMTEEIRSQLLTVLKEYGFPNNGHPQLRFLYPKGSLLAISTAGFYWPFVGECHVDPGLHPLQIPHVIAHELSHAYSITDEGACNFLAWMACRQSQDTYVRYAAQLSYWRQLNSSYRQTDKEGHSKFFETIDPRIVNDLYAIRDHMDQYPEYFTQLRNLFYGSYLRVQGVSDGLASYGRVVNLVMSWKEDQK